MLNWKRGLKTATTIALLTTLASNMDNKSINYKIFNKQNSKEISTSKNKEYEFSKQLFKTSTGKILTYNIATIPNTSSLEASVKISKKGKSVDDLVNGAKIGINASFFTPEGTIIGYVKSDGKVLNNKMTNVKLKGYLVKDSAGFDIKKDIDPKQYELVLESFPILEYNNTSYVKSKNLRSFRSAAAVDSCGNLYLITTENGLLSPGRVSFLEFKEFLETQNYKSVLNLDGGSSTQMFVDGEINQYASKIHSALGFY